MPHGRVGTVIRSTVFFDFGTVCEIAGVAVKIPVLDEKGKGD